MGFLRDEDYYDLPEDDSEAFAKLEALARERLYTGFRELDGELPYDDTLDYMNEVAALAAQFGLSAVWYEKEQDNYKVEFERFRRVVDAELTKIRVIRSRRDQRNSVGLSAVEKQKLRHHIQRLRDAIDGLDLPEGKKARLREKLAEFEAELEQRRVSLAKAMAVFAVVNVMVHGVAGTVNDIAQIVDSMTKLIGEAKVTEEDSAPRLPKPKETKAIEDKSKSENLAPSFGDDIPF